MEPTAVVEAAACAADGLARAQLISTVVIGVAAVLVPALFALAGRERERRNARAKARSFALAHVPKLQQLLDNLQRHMDANPKGEKLKAYDLFNDAVVRFHSAEIPVQDLHLLDDAAQPVQRTFSVMQAAYTYTLMRQSLANREMDIEKLDSEQGDKLHDAAASLSDGLRQISRLFS